MEREAQAEAIAAPRVGADGEDRSMPAPRVQSGAGRRDFVARPQRVEDTQTVLIALRENGAHVSGRPVWANLTRNAFEVGALGTLYRLDDGRRVE